MDCPPGLRWVLLWTAASFIGAATFIPLAHLPDALSSLSRAVSGPLVILAVGLHLLLAPALQWPLLSIRWGRPGLATWLLCVVLVSLAATAALTYLLAGSDLIAVLSTTPEPGAVERYDDTMGHWTSQTVLMVGTFSGYVVGLSIMSVRVGASFLGAITIGALVARPVEAACAALPAGLLQDAGWLASETMLGLFGGIGAMIGFRLFVTGRTSSPF